MEDERKVSESPKCAGSDGLGLSRTRCFTGLPLNHLFRAHGLRSASTLSVPVAKSANILDRFHESLPIRLTASFHKRPALALNGHLSRYRRATTGTCESIRCSTLTPHEDDGVASKGSLSSPYSLESDAILMSWPSLGSSIIRRFPLHSNMPQTCSKLQVSSWDRCGPTRPCYRA